jgi:[citrate (pro-3S)-lyase] ligase
VEIEYGRPLKGNRLESTRALLAAAGLDFDENAEATVNITENGALCATGSRQKNVLKCIAAAPEYKGEGLIATIVSELLKDAHAEGLTRLFIFTKPGNAEIFSGLGFYPVAATKDAVLLENRRNGIADYVKSLKRPEAAGKIGAVVANCNPFTNGHRYLIETAAKNCDFVYLFILSEDASEFPAEARLRLAQECTADLKNVAVCPTGDYLISYATFPDYFIKDKVQAKQINYALDLTVFAGHFARPLGITRRYVGTEPSCAVTAGYNAEMLKLLPEMGIEVALLERREHDGQAVSASTVRRLLAAGKLEDVKNLVPLPVYRYLKERGGYV